jgi:hypothetical protein
VPLGGCKRCPWDENMRHLQGASDSPMLLNVYRAAHMHAQAWEDAGRHEPPRKLAPEGDMDRDGA